MKNIAILSLLLISTALFSQENLLSIEKIMTSESKNASKLMAVKVNPNTANYDIFYHKLEFNVDPDVRFISGKVTTTYKALSDMNAISFDFSNSLTVSSVKKGNLALSFVQTANELVISFPTTQAIGSSDSVEITYSGVPTSSGFGSFITSTHAGAPIIWTLSEPFGAMNWWPCKNDLKDKIDSIDVYITAPKQYVSVSNGVEKSSPVINGEFKTAHFHHSYPIPAYLIAIAVTNYSVYNQVGGSLPNQYPIVNYIYPESLSAVIPKLEQTPLILNLFENLFEIYPFHTEKYGHAQFGWGGGMEHTTVSFMGGFERDLVAHEMAHQWFGDKITCATWKDIWLNEGFATYLASLVFEHFDGQTVFSNYKSQMTTYISSQIGGAVYLTDAEATDVSRIFDSRLTYYKGAMVLNMLRFKLGDALFFQGVKNYLADPNLAYKSATTAQLQTHLEAVYGSSLTEFFSDWIYNQGYPSYTISVQNLANSKVQFTINQSQSHPSVSFFEMPVPVRVFGSNGEQMDFVLNNTLNGEVFIKEVPFVVSNAVFDPNYDIISRGNKLTLTTNSFKLENLSLYPNPATTMIHLKKMNGISVQKSIIYNALGQKIKETNAETNWDISSFAKGFYSISIFTNEGTKQFQFIKN